MSILNKFLGLQQLEKDACVTHNTSVITRAHLDKILKHIVILFL